MVVIPWRGNLVFYTKMLPVGLQDKVAKTLGLHNQMSDFKGKGSMEKRIPGLAGGH